MITVVIVDDHPVVRAGMRMVLDAADDITIVAEGASGADALRLVAQRRPDVLVLDVNLPDLNGVEVTQRLREQGTTTAILILTVYDNSQTVFGLLESGATGYVLKDEALETLVSAVRSAARGESWLSPAVARQVVRRRGGCPRVLRTTSYPPHLARA
jgi:DNA-binding NarL/FixJ family response regulator